jgi:ribonuclease P protein component
VPAGRWADASRQHLAAVQAGAAGTEEAMSEAHISAERSPASQEARLPSPDADASWPGHLAVPSPQGSQAAVSLIWRVQGRSAFRAFHPSPATRDSPTVARPSRSRIGPVTVSFVNGNPAEPPRVAYAIGRKVGNAVERNRIRRQLRTIVRDLAPQLRPGMYLIGVAPSAQLRFGDLRLTVMRALDAIWKQETRRSIVAEHP